MRPFGCPVTILNTLDSLGKFEGKVDEGFLVGHSVNNKAFRVFNSRTRIVQETLHVNFLENKANIAGTGPTWLFDIDNLTRTMNYQPVTAGNQSNPSTGFQEEFDAGKIREEAIQQYMLFPVWSTGSTNLQNKEGDATFDGKSHVDYFTGNRDFNEEFEDYSEDSSNDVSAASLIVPTVGHNYSNSTNPISDAGPTNSSSSPTHGQSLLRDTYQPPDMVEREDIVYFDHENVGAEADFNNLETSITTYLHVCILSFTREPKRVHQALKDPSWIEAMQEELLQFKMQQVWILVDLPHGKREIENGFHRGQIDQTLFIKKQKGEILLVQIYVDDIIFGATNKDLCKSFEKLMKDKFQMSLMGELTFFLGLQVKQKEDGIFINQDKYVAEILKKFGLTEGKSASTPIDTEKPLLKDPDGEDVDVYIYRSMIRSLMYLTSSRPDIMFAVCACARFQVTPKVSHIHAVKRIFRYLKGKPNLGLWYPKDSPFDLVAYSDSDYAGASLDRKSTTGGCQFFGSRLISWQCKKQTVVVTSSIEAEYVAGASYCAQVLWIQNQMLDYGLWYPKASAFDLVAFSDSDYGGASQDRKSTTGGSQFLGRRSMIGSLMYLTSSRPDIMFTVCACARFQVTLKVSHIHAVKRIFRYLKGKPHLGLWYSKDSPFDLVAYSDNDYAGASLDRKSTTGGCQFLGSRLISWQCKKQTIVATSSTEAEYVAGASYCAQVPWIQN
nr:uncharacterized mitochondrial protein AtMg00810-like [Tanacetum cinerariifolium]